MYRPPKIFQKENNRQTKELRLQNVPAKQIVNEWEKSFSEFIYAA